MPATGNTTLPEPPSSSSSLSSCSAGPRLVLALFLCWSGTQPERIGEVALFDPHVAGPSIVGRAGVPFLQLRPDETLDGGPLTGRTISHQQFSITVEGDALLVRNIGKARVLVDGTEVPRGTAVLLRPGAILEVPGNCVLLVGLSPLSLAPPPARFLPLHPFGAADRLGIVGEGWRAHQLREDIAYAATAGRHVFVHGPTGTGKELVARGIHALSPRAGGPFLPANSASFTAELAALELFGSPKNYPNSGTPERIGYFARARHGTLFLDELGEVLAAVQAPLLRALDGAYARVGDPTPCPTECLVIVATNRDPASIKHDILPRLGVTVETPALADRREDLALLVRANLRARGDAGAALAVDASLIVGLLRSPLLGNVRDIDKILNASIAASGGKGPLRWPARLSLPPPAPLAIQAEPPVPPAEPSRPDVDELVAGIRGGRDPGKARVHQALVDHHWHYGRTAAALDISVDKLYRLRMKYDLHPPE